MATLRSAKRLEMPFQKALARAKTGDIIIISPAPAGIDEGERLPHKIGVMSLIKGNLYLNNTLICSNDVRETHGTFYPFYENILMYRTNGSEGNLPNGKLVHEFYWMRPSDPLSPSNNTTIRPRPAFRFVAKELKIIPLTSGKGLILIESNPQHILLLKKMRLLGATFNTISAKNIPVAQAGPYAICIETPSSVIVGVDVSVKGSVAITKYYRGHGRHRVSVYEQPSNTRLSVMATDVDFFFRRKINGVEAMVSATTGQSLYEGIIGDFYPTSKALVRRHNSIVEANGVIVNDTFHAYWIVPHAHGLLYGWCGEIRMLVIKDVPK